MTDTSNTEVREESGGALRDRLEEALKANTELGARNRTLEVQVAVQGFKYVKPEDLNDVPIDQVQAKAEALEASRIADREAMRAEVMAEMNLKTAGESKPLDPAITRVAALGTLGGTPPGEQKPVPQTPDDWLDLGLSKKK